MPRKPDAFTQWALARIARASGDDTDAATFGADYASASALGRDERRLVEAYPTRGLRGGELRTATRRLLDRHLANVRSPRALNQLFSGVEDEAMAGALLGVFSNNTLSTREIAPLPTEMERAVVSWMLRHVPWDGARSGGSATPGGSFSNYLGVYLARKSAEAKHGADVLPRLAFFGSRACHYSIPKGADLVGVPRDGMVEVPTDDADRMRPDALAKLIRDTRKSGREPFLVVATLGTTVAGALDPVREIADIARAEGVWLHVDGAWGCFGLLGPDAERFRRGLEDVDSLTFDEHKHGAAPVASSFLLVRDRTSLEELRPPTGGGYLFHRKDAPYEEQDLGLTSLYCGKPFLTLSSWLTWKSLGADGWRRRVAQATKLTRRFRDGIARSAGWELALEPETWLVCFRPKMAAVTSRVARDAVSRELRRRVNANGRWMLNLCPQPAGYVFRAVFTNPRMSEAHVDELLAHLEACAAAE